MAAIILRGSARELPLPDGSVDLVVTSPPYYRLRDYRDDGGSLAGQIGAEATPREYIAALLDCTREWVRVLKPTGSLFVNLGDKYSQRVATRRSSHQDGLFPGRPELRKDWKRDRAAGMARMPYENITDDTGRHVPEKSLMGLPWRYALGCIDDLGLILRAEILWSKPNGMPESVTDRVRRSHEQIFHLVKSPRYYAGVDEIREPPSGYARPANYDRGPRTFGMKARTLADTCNPLGKLPDSVWEIATQPLTLPASLGVEHWAAFPLELPRRCVLGWSPPGICTVCDHGLRPVSITERTFDGEPVGAGTGGIFGDAKRKTRNQGVGNWRFGARTTITGYTCACPSPDGPARPAVVLDPFGGTGTTALLADVLGRTGISVDLSADYCRAARWRTTDPGERARAMQVPKPAPEPDGQGALFDRNEI